MFRINLFSFKATNIFINVDAFFAEDSLVIEGQDIGKTVEDVWGEVDYEYSITVGPKEVKRLRSLFNIKDTAKDEFLRELARRFNGNYCWSEFRNYLDLHKIKYKSFVY
jgi:hypothetical protein